MKIMINFLSLIFLSLNAQASTIQLISLKAEAEPGKVAYLGINTDSKNQILDIYYTPSSGKTQNYSLAKLAKSQVLCSKKGYTLVSIRVPSSSGTSAHLNLNYYQSVFSSDVVTKHFNIKFNAHLNKYEILDQDERPFSKAYATTHRSVIGVATGIEEIRTQQ